MTRPPRLLRILVLLASLVLPGLGLARADEAPPRSPYEAIRALRRLQEKIAHGSTAAYLAQPALLASIGTQFVDADPIVWREARNTRAAILYLFSGGKPFVVRTILSRSTMPRETDRLLKGALAYAEGQDQVARDLLDPIDPRSLSAVVGGQLALVEATLFAPSDPRKAARLLEMARLLVPGSLIEEAALRRQVTLETDPALLDAMVAHARQYLHRYPASIYAQNFKQHFAAAAVKIAAEGDAARIGRLDPAIKELPQVEQRNLLLAMAKVAMVGGHTDAARFAAARAATIAKDATHDATRAQLYLDAASIVSDDVIKGIAALEAADGSRLSPEDADFRDAALAVARSVQAPVPESAGPAGATPGGNADDKALVDQARQALATGDDLLQKAH